MSEIKSLSVREQCRLKLPIFYGSVDNYQHGFKEVMANAIDEIINNFDYGEIRISLSEDCKIISVEDSGRGVPIGESTNGVPNYELLFERLFTGTNFENNKKGNEKVTTGVNGSGTCVLNHTSELFMVDSFYNNKHYQLKYINGGERQYLKEIEDNNNGQHGSRFTFKLDDKVYPNTTYIVDEIKEIIRHCSATVGNIKFTFEYKNDIIEYNYNTLDDYFDSITDSLTSKKIHIPLSKYDLENELNEVECIVSSSSNNIQESYLNANFLPEGGTINDGIIEGFRISILEYAKKNKMLDKNIKTISNEDVEGSLCFLVKWSSTNVEYTNQTKFSSKKKLYKKIAKDYVQNFMQVYMVEQEEEFKKLVSHVLEITKFNNKSKINKEALKKKLSEKIDGINNKIEGLVDCKIHGEEAELYITEGLSGLGGMVLARNPITQAGMPIRGKILNCLKEDYNRIFKSPIITNLIKVIGCGIEGDKKNKDLGMFDINKLRYGKIIFLCDEDPDARNIVALLLTMFYRLMPTLIKEGRIYVAKTPLFEIRNTNTDEMFYAYSDQEKDSILKTLNSKNIKISRNKGIGENDALILNETAMNPETRHIVQVNINNISDMINSFEVWMDNDVTMRKEYIENNLDKYVIEE